jgi:hypothetical protein
MKTALPTSTGAGKTFLSSAGDNRCQAQINENSAPPAPGVDRTSRRAIACSPQRIAKGCLMSQLIGTGWKWCFGGDNGYSATLYMSFAPINGVAQTTLGTSFAFGFAGVGFPTYTYRPNPNGGDIPVNHGFSEYYDYPPNVWNAHLSSVTAELDMGGDLQSASMVVNVFAW